MARFRKKPVVIPVVVDAVQWNNRKIICPPGPEWFAEAEENGTIRLAGDALLLKAPEGDMRAQPGDWIIRGEKGEIYPCRDDVFAEAYEPE